MKATQHRHSSTAVAIAPPSTAEEAPPLENELLLSFDKSPPLPPVLLLSMVGNDVGVGVGPVGANVGAEDDVEEVEVGGVAPTVVIKGASDLPRRP